MLKRLLIYNLNKCDRVFAGNENPGQIPGTAETHQR